MTNAVVADAVGPLTTQITSLTAQVGSLVPQLASLNGQLAARPAAAPRPLRLTLSSTKLDLGAVTAMVTGAANQPLTVRVAVSKAVAKALKLKSATLATNTTKLNDQGAALVLLRLDLQDGTPRQRRHRHRRLRGGQHVNHPQADQVRTDMFRQLSISLAGALALLLTIGAVSASAHVNLVSTSPKAKSSRSSSPTSVSMTFSGPLRSGTLVVVNASGKTVSSGKGGRDPRNINRLLVSVHGLKAGKYTAKGSTVSADGHSQAWSFWFRVK